VNDGSVKEGNDRLKNFVAIKTKCRIPCRDEGGG